MPRCLFAFVHITDISLYECVLFPDDETSENSSDPSQKKKCKRRWGAKSRWGDSDELEKETVLSGLPTVIPSGLTKEQEEQYLCKSLRMKCNMSMS